MKTNPSPFRRLTAVAALLGVLAHPSFAQTTAASAPFAFVPLTVEGGGSIGSPRLSLISPTITQPIAWQGAISSVAISGGNTIISVAGAPWTANRFNGANGNYYAEIVTAPGNTHATGALAVITATATGSLTVPGNLTSPTVFAATGDLLRIRKETTIGDLFGATNTAGLLASDDPTTADEVLIYDGANSLSYFYFSGNLSGNAAGWYSSGSFTPAGNVVIGPHQGVVVKRKAAAALTFTANGVVKTGDTIFPVVNGLNVLGTVSASGLTLATSGLYSGSATTGVKASSDPTTADEVTIYTAGGPVKYFYYTGDASNAAGWRTSGAFALSDSVALSPGVAFILNRKGGPSFNWSLPSPSSF